MDQKKKGKRRMLRKLKKNGRRITALILSLLTVLSMVSSSASTVFAADGTLYFNSGENIPYGTYSTTRMTFDGSNTAYCLKPYRAVTGAQLMPDTYCYKRLKPLRWIRQSINHTDYLFRFSDKICRRSIKCIPAIIIIIKDIRKCQMSYDIRVRVRPSPEALAFRNLLISISAIQVERKVPEQKNSDKGILAKVQKAFLAYGSHFSEMEKQTENLLKKAERSRNGGEKKKSVKAEIQQIKSERSDKPILPPVPQDKAR